MTGRNDCLFTFFSARSITKIVFGTLGMAFFRPRIFASLILACFRRQFDFVSLLRLPIDWAAIRNSPLFDHEWYVRNHPELEHSRLSPELHYLLDRSTTGRWASPAFSGDAYLEQNPEVRDGGVNPLVHYELYGRFIGCPISAFDSESAPVFPAGTIEAAFDFAPPEPGLRRIAVFASYSSDGRIPEKDIVYLRGLRKVCSGIVVVFNSPIFPEEAENLRRIVSSAIFKKHGGYDFGSYRIGFEHAQACGWLSDDLCDELVFANGSCYAPVRPFSELFHAMKRSRADFWGLTANTQRSGKPHLQSYFLVFRRSILDGGAIERFFAARPHRATRADAISLFEIQLTDELREQGFVPDTFVKHAFPPLHEFNPTTRPLDLIRRHGVPLVKVKALRGETSQPPRRIMECVRKLNPELASVMKMSEPPPPRVPTRDEIVARHQASLARIRARMNSGSRANVVFLVSSPSMFPAAPLFETMRRDPAFDAKIAAIPDLRWNSDSVIARMERCEREISEKFGAAMVLRPLRPGPDGQWPDVLRGFDFAVYPSPYEFSDWHYNPMHCEEAGVLGIGVNYGFYRSRYDRYVMRLESYARLWKAFFECEATAKEYAEHSILKGSNAEVVGYVKMDALASAKPWPRNGNRKRVLIAPHHSVEGGANDTLALSNFQRYADYFLALPEKHPELDFVFRPHPFLFTVLARKNKWGPEKVEDWIARMKAHPNVRWSDEGDYFPAFASCDACVQDCGSYLVEWFYTGKPCCYMLKSPADIDAKFAPLGKECLSHCYVAYHETAIEAFLRDVVEGGQDSKAEARETFRKTVMANYPHAADAALQSIRKALGIPTGK